MLVQDIKGIQNGRLVSKDSERIRYRVFKFHVKTLQREYLNLPLMTKTEADYLIKIKGTAEAPWMYAKEPVIETKDSAPDVAFRGLSIYIENPKGSVRHWETEEGESGKTKMFYPYGYIKKTEGTDGDEIDCFIGPDEEAEDVFVIAHMLGSEYDEDKVMLGFSDSDAARDAFLAHYQDASHLGKITKIRWEDFVAVIKHHKRGTRITK